MSTNESEQRIHPKNFEYYISNNGSTIFTIDVVFKSPKKLLLLDKNNKNRKIDIDTSEYHKIQFEKTVASKGYGIVDFIKIYFWLENLYGNSDPFKDTPWIISDIDDSLKGVPT